MTTRKLFRSIPFTAVVVAAYAATLLAQNASPSSPSSSASPSLQEQLEAQYPLAKMTTKGGCAITNRETGLALQKAGIGALPQNASSTVCAAHYRNGSIAKPGFKCNYWLNVTKQALVTLEKGDKVFPTKLEVGRDEVKIAFGYCSGDPGQAAVYTGQVVIEFPRDSLKTTGVTQIEDKIAEVFSADNIEQRGQGGGQQDGQQSNQQGQDSAPQDNQGSACNVEIGQTIDQLVSACGQPANQAKGAGTKLIYFYTQPKLKVTLVDNKVADID
jgi:hypothetical protein